MAQFTVYENRNSRSKKIYPYLLDIQSNLLEELRTTIVIPLGLKSSDAITKLCPVVDVLGKQYIVFTQLLSGIDRNQLGKEIQDRFYCALDHFRCYQTKLGQKLYRPTTP